MGQAFNHSKSGIKIIGYWGYALKSNRRSREWQKTKSHEVFEHRLYLVANDDICAKNDNDNHWSKEHFYRFVGTIYWHYDPIGIFGSASNPLFTLPNVQSYTFSVMLISCLKLIVLFFDEILF